MGDDDTWSDLPPLPPYLFRAASDQSRGKNTAEEIDPLHGYDRDYHANVTELELETPNYATAEWMVRNHVEYKYVVPSEFHSWSVSPLWVLVHAVRKHLYLQETNILIYVVDTSRLHSSRIHNATHLLKKYKSKCNADYQKYVAKHEYLIHGRLWSYRQLWRAVPLETLITAGLWKAFISLSDSDGLHDLNSQVSRIRYQHKTNPSGAGYFTQDHEMAASSLRVLSDLAECFGRGWRGVMMIAFIAIKQRELTVYNLKILFDDLTELGVQVPSLPWRSDLSLQAFKLLLREVLEAWQFMELLCWLRARQRFLEKSRQDSKALAGKTLEAQVKIRPAGSDRGNAKRQKREDEVDKENDDPLLLNTPPGTSN